MWTPSSSILIPHAVFLDHLIRSPRILVRLYDMQIYIFMIVIVF